MGPAPDPGGPNQTDPEDPEPQQFSGYYHYDYWMKISKKSYAPIPLIYSIWLTFCSRDLPELDGCWGRRCEGSAGCECRVHPPATNKIFKNIKLINDWEDGNAEEASLHVPQPIAAKMVNKLLMYRTRRKGFTSVNLSTWSTHSIPFHEAHRKASSTIKQNNSSRIAENMEEVRNISKSTG